MPSITLPISELGPVIEVALQLSKPHRSLLAKHGLPIPQPILVKVLVDTGASATCIDQAHLKLLGIKPTGVVLMYTPSTKGKPVHCNQYDIDLSVIMGGAIHHLQTLPLIETVFTGQGIDGLLGRDALAHGLLIYNGSEKEFTLTF